MASPDALRFKKKGQKKTLNAKNIRNYHLQLRMDISNENLFAQTKIIRIFQSISRKGNCYDNSIMENFFGILKQKIYYVVVYYSYEELKETIEKHIRYYNEKKSKRN